jgi:hypothetical protein
MSDVSERNYGNKAGIGQHRVGDVGGGNTGQKNVRGTAADVGMESGGERQNGPVPASAPDSDISTQTGVARNSNDRALRHPK